jgi:hypothetical protein
VRLVQVVQCNKKNKRAGSYQQVNRTRNPWLCTRRGDVDGTPNQTDAVVGIGSTRMNRSTGVGHDLPVEVMIWVRWTRAGGMK